MLNENCLPALNTEIWAIVNKLVIDRFGSVVPGKGLEVRKIRVIEVTYGTNNSAVCSFYGRLSGYSSLTPLGAGEESEWLFRNIPLRQCFMTEEEAEQALEEGVEKLYA